MIKFLLPKNGSSSRLRRALPVQGWGWACVLLCILLTESFSVGLFAAETGSKKYKRSKLTSDESEALADRRKLLLTTGEDRAVDLDFEANAGSGGLSIGNPTLVTTTFVKIGDKRQIVFKPLKAGETTVTIRDQDGTIRLVFQLRVTGSNLLRVAGELRSLIGDVEGLSIRIVGAKIVIEGDVLVVNDFGKVSAVLADKAYSDVVLNLIALSPLALQVMAKKIEEDVKPIYPSVKVRVVNGSVFIEGEVGSQSDSDKVTRIATLYLPEVRPPSFADRDEKMARPTGPPRSVIQNFLVIKDTTPKKKDKKLIRVTVHFVELSKDYLKIFGFKWQPGFSAEPTISVGQGTTGATAATGASFSATISSLVPRLESLQKSGYARVLKTGTVIVKSGEPATIKEQTQIPVAAQAQGGQVQGAPQGVGITVNVTPQQIGQSDDISMTLKLEAISVVGRQPAGAAALTATHIVDTQLFVKSGKSAAVAGVNSADVGTDFNKDDPKAGAFAEGTSPLFTMMRTKNYRKKKSQFVVFVTPEIIEDASDGNEDLKKNFRVQVK